LSGTRDFELAEDALRDKLVEARKLGNRDNVMETYDQLIALYDQYGYLSKQTDNDKAAETRRQLTERSGNWIFGDAYRRLTSVFTPEEAIHILRYQKDQFDATQARDTSPTAKGARQVTANQMAPVLSFVDQIEQAAALQKLETINQFLSSGEMGERRSAFIDVDEQALQEGRTAITNVYFDFGNGKQIKVLSHENTGIRQDRRITASHELLQALLTAFNPQEPNK
jgi:hypothetical protein